MTLSRVIVLDDDPLMLKLLAHQLTSLGAIEVECHTSGAAALAALDRQPAHAADLLLVDLNMPGMDGIEFLRHLGQRRHSASIALVSGEDARILAAADRLAQALDLRVLSHLTKPVTPDALRDLLARAGGQTAVHPRNDTKTYCSQEIQRAIEHNELRNHYQPIVRLDSGQLHGVEALVRWLHPTDGLVFPDQFIGVAEQHGLIDRLTQTVLDEALDQTRRWRVAGLPLRIAVNVSMSSLAQVGFADSVADALARHGLGRETLSLEVTESHVMRDVRTTLDVLTRLRLKRISLSIDDFGTGYSSFNQLHDLPFDELKIDRGFTHGASHDDTRRAIFQASLDIARKLGMKSIAEGVEDGADFAFARSRRCDLAQGYHIARPMPADRLPAWLRTWPDGRRMFHGKGK